MKKTYYDRQIIPIIQDCEGKPHKPMIKIHNPYGESTKHMDINILQLEQILNILNQNDHLNEILNK